MRYNFPDSFIWGTATAAAQIEGAAFEDQKGLSIWDVFSHIPGKIEKDENPDIACDFYHRYEEDIKTMKAMGIKSFRFSFSWARIIPDGDGVVNQAGIDFYKRLIRCLKENEMIPMATMYHWDLPYALQCKGGFGNREMVEWFKNYAEILLDNFGSEIDYWATFNEPIAVLVGYAWGFFAPGLTDEKYGRQALHNLLLAHGETVKLFRRKQSEGKVKGQIGIVVDVWKHYPGRPGNPEDEEMATFNNEVDGYGIFLNPLFLGEYTENYLKYLEENNFLFEIREGDMDLISTNGLLWFKFLQWSYR